MSFHSLPVQEAEAGLGQTIKLLQQVNLLDEPKAEVKRTTELLRELDLHDVASVTRFTSHLRQKDFEDKGGLTAAPLSRRIGNRVCRWSICFEWCSGAELRQLLLGNSCRRLLFIGRLTCDNEPTIWDVWIDDGQQLWILSDSYNPSNSLGTVGSTLFSHDEELLFELVKSELDMYSVLNKSESLSTSVSALELGPIDILERSRTGLEPLEDRPMEGRLQPILMYEQQSLFFRECEDQVKAFSTLQIKGLPEPPRFSGLTLRQR